MYGLAQKRWEFCFVVQGCEDIVSVREHYTLFSHIILSGVDWR